MGTREFLFLVAIILTTLGVVQNVAGEDSVFHEELSVRFVHGCGVFNPHEVVALEILPRSPRVVSEKLNQLVVSLHRTSEPIGDVRNPTKKNLDDSNKLSSVELEIAVPENPANFRAVPVSLIMPAAEGVYQISVSFQRKTEPSTGYSLLVNPLQRRPAKVVVQRDISCVVVDSAPIQRRIGKLLIANDKEQPETVDTTNPAWWKRLTKVPALPKVGSLYAPRLSEVAEIPKIPGFRTAPTTPAEKELQSLRRGPLSDLLAQWKSHGDHSFGSGHFKQQTMLPTLSTPISSLTASGQREVVPWEAIPLVIKEPGKPHLLELEYPSGVLQTLGISVVELLNAGSGTVPMVSVESGIDVADEIVSDASPKRMLTHRIVFWPKTKAPMLLLTNRHPNRDAMFGKVNAYQLAESPEKLPKPFEGESKRLVAGFIQRPEILAILASTTETTHAQTMVGPSEWEVFFEGASRFVDLLQLGGYNGAMFVVAADGGTLYPSKLLGTNSTFQSMDGTMVGSDGQPVSKDVLELIARLFDRENLTLIPTIDFNSPLPMLERLIQQNPRLATEISLIGPNGLPLAPMQRTPNVNGPYYNLLHPLVQEAMLDVVKELAVRYSKHSSFGGVSVLLTAEGFAQLSDLYWGIDDVTVARFQQETNTVFAGEASATTENTSPNRFLARAQFLQANPSAMKSWIHWRALKIHDFYRRVSETITAVRPDATLYLAGGTMLDGASIQQYCQPSLFHKTTLSQALCLIGFDVSLFAETPSIAFLKPNRTAVGDPETAALYQELESAEIGNTSAPVNGFAAGTLFYHDSIRNELGGPGTLIVPAERQNRRRFVKQLAQGDSLALVDGGELLPAGESEMLYELFAAFRRLPKTPFKTLSLKNTETEKSERSDSSGSEPEKSLQPLTVRFLNTPSETFVYLVNDAPFGVEAKLLFITKPEAVLDDVGGLQPLDQKFVSRNQDQLSWMVSLKPYDFIAVRLDDPAAKIQNVEVYRPKDICGPAGILKRKVDELGGRIQTARNGIPWNKLENPGFEPQNGNSEELFGWNRVGSELLTARLDTTTKLVGESSLKLQSQITPASESGIVFSKAFPAPTTGRLFASAFVGVPANTSALPINVVLNAKHQGSYMQRSFRIEPMVLPFLSKSTPINGVHWQKIIVPFDRLPQTNLDDVRIGFEMVGPGTAWIDDVNLYQIAFTRDEQSELYRKVFVADFRCSTDRVSELLALMEGYWPRFLSEHVPLPTPAIVAPAPMVAATTTSKYAENKAVSPVAPAPVQGSEKRNEQKKNESPGLYQRFKNWVGR